MERIPAVVSVTCLTVALVSVPGADDTGVMSNAPALTAAQQSTVDYFRGIARETGATIEVSIEDGAVYIIETASAEWDNERMIWQVSAEGVAHIF